MTKQKSHEISLRLTFDQPVSRATALRAARNNLVPSELYASIAEENASGWSKARIVSAKRHGPENSN